jgi:hypothetical protein
MKAAILILKRRFLVPKLQLGNAAGEAPASRDGRRTEAGASVADAFPSRGLGTRKMQAYVELTFILSFFLLLAKKSEYIGFQLSGIIFCY